VGVPFSKEGIVKERERRIREIVADVFAMGRRLEVRRSWSEIANDSRPSMYDDVKLLLDEIDELRAANEWMKENYPDIWAKALFAADLRTNTDPSGKTPNGN
jgi:hypothetical protein